MSILSAEKLSNYPFRTFLRLSILRRTQANFDSAAYFLGQAKKLLPEDTMSSLHASYYASSGVLANYKSNNLSAVRLLKKSLAIRVKLRDSTTFAATWRNLGVCYLDLSNYDSANYCFTKAELILDQQENPETRMVLLLNKGEMYFALGNISEAIKNYNLALDKLQLNTYRKY